MRRERQAPQLLAAAAALILAGLGPGQAASAPVASVSGLQASILVYHRFGSVVADSTTVRTSTFRRQLDDLHDHGYAVVPLRALVDFLWNDGPPPPRRSVVITVDDGHRSVFTDMRPIVLERRIPVTLFVYPSAISNASYALTWAQLASLRDTGLFDIQSHTYWHPNFRVERERLAPAAYRAFATSQLCRAKTVLEDRLARPVNLLAWPFGIYDDELVELARDCGYVAGVALRERLVTPTDNIMALPRFFVTDAAVGRAIRGARDRIRLGIEG